MSVRAKYDVTVDLVGFYDEKSSGVLLKETPERTKVVARLGEGLRFNYQDLFEIRRGNSSDHHQESPWPPHLDLAFGGDTIVG